MEPKLIALGLLLVMGAVVPSLAAYNTTGSQQLWLIAHGASRLAGQLAGLCHPSETGEMQPLRYQWVNLEDYLGNLLASKKWMPLSTEC